MCSCFGGVRHKKCSAWVCRNMLVLAIVILFVLDLESGFGEFVLWRCRWSRSDCAEGRGHSNGSDDSMRERRSRGKELLDVLQKSARGRAVWRVPTVWTALSLCDVGVKDCDKR